jgi:hypothetical protein
LHWRTDANGVILAGERIGGPMLFFIALLAQSTNINAAEARDAALTCARAVPVAPSAKAPHMRLTAQVTYFVMQAAKADPAGKPFLERVGELMNEAAQQSMSAASGDATMPGCDRRFPLARAAATVKLPKDPFERDVTCFGTLALLQGAAQQFKQTNGDGGSLDRIKAVLDPLTGRMTDDALRTHGITDDASFGRYMGDWLQATLAQGNAEAVARACGVSSL